MELADWYRFRESEGYAKMGQPSREKRKITRENEFMSKKRGPELAGIWTEPGLLSFADGEKLKSLGTDISTAMFVLRADPNPANDDALMDAINKFRTVWKPLHDKRVDTGSQQTMPQTAQGTRKR